MTTETERWRLEEGGRVHEVTLADKDVRREVVWSVDGEEVSRKMTSDDRTVLVAEGHGAVGLRLSMFGGAARRVTWWGGAGDGEAKLRAHTGVGGSDFEAVAGRALEREEWIRAHPTAFAVRRTLAATVTVLLPFLVVWLLARFALPAVPWPDIALPRIPWPDIPWPQIPWPDINLPQIPWPDWRLPAWVEQVVQAAKYVVPVLLAAALAGAEVRRRRRQDEARRTRRGEQGTPADRSLEG